MITLIYIGISSFQNIFENIEVAVAGYGWTLDRQGMAAIVERNYIFELKLYD
jgi:hypothetical protein